MRHVFLLVLAVVLLIAAARACVAIGPGEGALAGPVILWHSWSEADTLVLEESLASFEELHPDVDVVSVAVPAEYLHEQFVTAAANGVGPDLLLGSSDWVRDLADRGLIRPVTADDGQFGALRSEFAATVSYQDQPYGVPLSLWPRAMFYDQRKVDAPAVTLDDLLAHAADGDAVAMVPRFRDAYWGIQAFGQGLFDANGRFTLASSGFREWLEWLAAAQNEPGVILNVDDESLQDLFTSGKVAYYIADPARQAAVGSGGGEGREGVTVLPAGPVGAAGPLLPAEALMFYADAGERQTRIAGPLAAFLSNPQQSVRFMRLLAHVPAHPDVVVDARLYPTVAGFRRQAEEAVILPNEIPLDVLATAGDRAYASTLSGAEPAWQAVCRFGQEVIVALALSPDQVDLPPTCVFPPPDMGSDGAADSGLDGR